MEDKMISDPRFPMLDRISGILGVYRDGDSFYLGDEVDRYTGVDFTREQLVQLAKELRAIAGATAT